MVSLSAYLERARLAVFPMEPVTRTGKQTHMNRLLRGAIRRVIKPVQERRHQVMYPILLKRATPVLVYQMGKVGSSSVGKSLAASYPGIAVNAHDFSNSHHKWTVRRLYRAVMLE